MTSCDQHKSPGLPLTLSCTRETTSLSFQLLLSGISRLGSHTCRRHRCSYLHFTYDKADSSPGGRAAGCGRNHCRCSQRSPSGPSHGGNTSCRVAGLCQRGNEERGGLAVALACWRGQLLSVFSPRWSCLGQAAVIKFLIFRSALKEPVDQAEAIIGGFCRGKRCQPHVKQDGVAEVPGQGIRI